MSKKKRLTKIAENIKKLKKEQGLSQSDLCKKTDLAYHTIAKIENGATPDPRISTVRKLAEALGVTLEKLAQ